MGVNACRNNSPVGATAVSRGRKPPVSERYIGRSPGGATVNVDHNNLTFTGSADRMRSRGAEDSGDNEDTYTNRASFRLSDFGRPSGANHVSRPASGGLRPRLTATAPPGLIASLA